jgi:septum formation protein
MRFCAIAADIDEPRLSHGGPAETVARLATAKAATVAEQCELRHAPPWVIGADTVVTVEDRIFGQPHDPETAARMIRSLAGRDHRVLTGLAILDGPTVAAELVETTTVRFRPIGEDELARYVAGNDWHGKAGAYAIQGDAGAFVEAVEGDVWNVVGFPVRAFLDRARTIGIPIPEARLVRTALASLWARAPVTGQPEEGRWGPRWNTPAPRRTPFRPGGAG